MIFILRLVVFIIVSRSMPHVLTARSTKRTKTFQLPYLFLYSVGVTPNFCLKHLLK